MGRKMKRCVLLIFLFLMSSSKAFSQPEYSFFVIHCDPWTGNEFHFRMLIKMVDTATAYGVPLTLEFTPQWVEMILADENKLKRVRTWQEWGHEIAAHHHSIFHCFWDSLTNYSLDSIVLYQPISPNCDSGVLKSRMQVFWDNLDLLAGDSLLYTWGSSDRHPAVDLYPNVPFRTDGGRDSAVQGFSNPYKVVHGPTVIDGVTYGPYVTCQINYFFIDNINAVNRMINLYNNRTFSNRFRVVGVVTHVFDFRADSTFYYNWIRFISGKGCRTVRQILRPVCDQITAVRMNGETLKAENFTVAPNPFDDVVTITLPSYHQTPYSIEVLSIVGKRCLVVSKTFEQIVTVNTSSLAPGLYFIRVLDQFSIVRYRDIMIKR